MAYLHGQPRWANRGWFRRHSLSLILVVLLIIQALGYFWLEFPEWRSQRLAHGLNKGTVIEFARHYWSRMLVSILADTYGALLLVLATKWFYEQGSAESRDDEDTTNR